MSSIWVTFLGTSSGGGPSDSRNCSSLVVDMVQDRSLWMVDCAEGTTRQFQLQPYTDPAYNKVMISKVNKLFITHMHADHIMGTIAFLRNVLYPPLSPNSRYGTSSNPYLVSKPVVEVYGPAGLRLFVRQNLKFTATRTAHKYVVHELLTSTDSITPCIPTPEGAYPSALATQPDVMHPSECVGRDMRASEDGLWRSVIEAMGCAKSKVVVDAGPILHRDPCIGYTFTEQSSPSRKLVILGDTYDPSTILPLCSNPPPALLIHEATDSHIEPEADSFGKLSRRTQEEVLSKALERGHSVPAMAGAFAKKVGTGMMVMNHIGSRFPAPRHARDHWRNSIMGDIEKKATEAWGVPGKRARAAWDFMQVEVPIPKVPIQANSFSAIQGQVDIEDELELEMHEDVEVVSQRGDSDDHDEAGGDEEEGDEAASETLVPQFPVPGRGGRGGRGGGFHLRGRAHPHPHVPSQPRGRGRGGHGFARGARGGFGGGDRGRGGGGRGGGGGGDRGHHPYARGGHGGGGGSRRREDDDVRGGENKRRRGA
ncbi:beta-lactamase-like protein [Panaeolus papilionaceus]|nr:beta-lactamase-like protein [Panaeolus papilionaceus]